MTRESRSKADLRIVWMGIDDEVFVRRHRVHACGGVRNLTIQRRNPGTDRRPNCHLIPRTNDPVDCGWSAFLTARMNSYFWIAGFPGSRHSVEHGALLRLPNKNRKDSPIECGRLASRSKPKHDSSGDGDGHRNAWDEFCKPGSNRDHQRSGLVGLLFRRNAYTFTRLRSSPRKHWLFESKIGSPLRGTS